MKAAMEKEARLKQFASRHGEMAQELARQSAAVAAILTAKKKSEVVLHPERNKFLGRWDGLTALALFYTASITPFETAFIPPVLGTSSWVDPFFLINRALDVIFFLDMLLQFFVAYQTGNDFGGRTWVTSPSKVARHYLRGWFLLDAFTVIVPGGFDVYLSNPEFNRRESRGSEVGAEGRMSVLRVLRVIRLVKLVRLVRASRIFQRWRSKFSMTYATQTVLQCVILLVCGAHWYACVIALQASLHADINETWMGEELYAICAKPASSATHLGSSGLPGCEHLSIDEWYLSSFSWSVMIITGTGGTDFYPSKMSPWETLVVTSLVLLGAFIWTTVLALFCDVATNSNPAMTLLRQRLDGLNLLIAIHELPDGMAQRLRSFYHQQK